MFGLTFQYVDTSKRVTDAADRATITNVGHAAAAIRKEEIASIVPGQGPSQPGTPPHTHTAGIVRRGKRKGQPRLGQLPKSMAFDVDKSKKDAVVGPRESIVGLSAHAHEFGDQFHGQDYPERSFAKPALEKVAPRFADSFAGSVSG